MSQIKLTANHCDVCGHNWLPTVNAPKHCPKCKSRLWNGSTKKIIHAVIKTVIIMAFLGLPMLSQELPDDPMVTRSQINGWHSPIYVAQKRNIVTLDHALMGSDAVLRGLDAYTTHINLSDPCKCRYEEDPIAPGSGKLVPTVAFQASMFLAVTASYEIMKHLHHQKIARAILVLDNISEGYAVTDNWTHRPNAHDYEIYQGGFHEQ